MTHELKTLPQYFRDTKVGKKNFEIRKDDRPYKVGDKLYLRKWSPGTEYTGEEIWVEITYILRDCPEYGLMPGYCIIGHKRRKYKWVEIIVIAGMEKDITGSMIPKKKH